MRTLALILAISACTPTFTQVGRAPGDAAIFVDGDSVERWTPRVAQLTSDETQECLRWFAVRDIDTTPWRYLRIEIRTLEQRPPAGSPHAELTGSQLIRVNWLRDDTESVVGRLVCHEMGHRFISHDHSVMRAAGYPW